MNDEDKKLIEETERLDGRAEFWVEDPRFIVAARSLLPQLAKRLRELTDGQYSPNDGLEKTLGLLKETRLCLDAIMAAVRRAKDGAPLSPISNIVYDTATMIDHALPQLEKVSTGEARSRSSTATTGCGHLEAVDVTSPKD
jgi:hypothetical protein